MPFPNPDSQFRPGASGNPAGRPKGRSLSALIREVLDGDRVEGVTIPPGKTAAEVLANRIVYRALKGDPAAVREVLDRTEGRARQSVDLTSGGEPLQTVLYLPENGRDPDPDPGPGPGDPPPAGAPGGVPL